jgi:outer membrane protein insertion porin family
MADLMTHSRRHGAAVLTGLALLMGSTAMLAPAAAYAQAQQGVVQRIVVIGNERIEASTIASYIPIQPGEAVDSARIDLALKTLFRTELFADVKIDLQGGDLNVRVVENPIINKVVFEGNSSVKDDKIKEELTIRPRGIFTRAKVQSDVQRIIELYRRSGRISATVTPKVVELPQKRVDLIFEINEGPKSGVLDVNFLGNEQFSDGDLADVVVTRKPPGTSSCRPTTTTTRTGSSTTRNSCASTTATAATTTSASSRRLPSWPRTRTASSSPTRSKRA